MESVASRPFAHRYRPLPSVDLGIVSIWALAGGLVLYLALDGGGYDIVVHSQVGILVWWILLVGAAWGLLPARRLSRGGWVAIAVFVAFVAWTALATTWSVSSERSLADLSLVAGYLGLLVLGIAIHGERHRALRHTLAALATAVTIVAALALASRLHPGLIPAAEQTSSFLGGTWQRLAWPLNYWNALGALMGFGLPLLLALATTARTLYGQAAAAAAIPIVALCGYLTFSRGGALAGAAALIVFVALAPGRLPKLATILTAAAGSAALIAGAAHRSALEHGSLNSAALHQGETLILPIVLVCAGVALTQVGIGLAVRHATPPRLLVVPPRRARLLLAAAVPAIIIAALLAGAPTKLSHAWRDFERPPTAVLGQASLSRYSGLSGNGRYDAWRGAVDATGGHVLGGSGPGTFQLLWLPRAPYYLYIQNAHSLYLETLAEEGVVGLALLVGFLALVLGSAVALVVRARHEERARAAGAAAAFVAFLISATFDWIWQVPVLPAAFLLLAAAVLAPRLGPARAVGAGRTGRLAGARSVVRLGAVILAGASLIAIAIPLATASAIRQSQAAASRGDPSRALADARSAARLEPGAATPQTQLALVLELRGHPRDGLVAARRAVRDEPANWSAWLIVSRLQAEVGHPGASFAAYRRARSLNPGSPLFAR